MRFFTKNGLQASKSIESNSTTAEPAAPKVHGKDADFGTYSTIKTFYQKKNNGRSDWVDYPPKQLAKKIERANDRVAIKIYKVFDNEQPTISSKTPLKVQQVDLQSPILVTALKDILEKENIFLEATETASFQAPFKPLFFAYPHILVLHSSTAEGVLKQHLRLLVQVVNDLFLPIFARLKNLKASGLFSYDLAWAFFPRDSLVFSNASDCTRVLKVLDTEYVQGGDAKFVIEAKEITFDGKGFAWKGVTLTILPFAGNVPITLLPNYPLEFHAEKEEVRGRLMERARKVLAYQGLEYREYEGIAICIEACLAKKHNVTGRILVDYYGYQKHHKGLQRSETSENSKYVQRLSNVAQQANIDEMLANEQDLIFVSPILPGFSLKTKLWLNFYVDDIKPVTWNDAAYTHLVYPEEQKDLVLTFVTHHQRLKTTMDDVIMGKGQGLILLLSGPPGTGKTLTAEAVADKTRRPLYYLQAEDLGTSPASLGPKIKKVFEMATEWNAVILLDEADVFMAQRCPADILRNELVSIFLRELEYFQGIIFLTTNLYDTVDVAFRSRVNIHLKFSALPAAARTLLWEKFLQRALPLPDGQAGMMGERDMRELGRWTLNGREIKNAVKTVRTWCVCKGFGEMTLERLEAGIRVTAPQAEKERN